MTTDGLLHPFTIDTEANPGTVVRPSMHSWTFIERTGVLHSEQGIGSYVEHDTGAVLNTNNQPTFNARGAFPWFRWVSTKAIGDGLVTIRGRAKNDDGSRAGTPSEYEFDLNEYSTGHVFVSPIHMADNCGLLVNSQGGFDGTIDYGVVAPFNIYGALGTLWGADAQIHPIDQLIENWLFAWSIRKFVAGPSGGISNVVATRTYRHNDSPFKVAAHGEPGRDFHLKLNEQFTQATPNEGIIIDIAAKACAATLTLYTS